MGAGVVSKKTIQNDKSVIKDFPQWLQSEFDSRCKRNPRYSLRAFAQLLEIDPSSLSQYMHNKRKASNKMIQRFCDKLKASAEQKKVLLQKVRLDSIKAEQTYIELQENAFKVISEWYHIAIMELSCTKDFNPQSQVIAKRLGIATEEVEAALSRLESLELIKYDGDTFVKTNRNLTNFSPGITSRAHKHFQKQVITKALNAVDSCSSQEKDITTMSMAIDKNKLEEARALITDFRKKMCQFLEDGNQTEVYNLSIQLYPISNNK